MAFQLLLDMNLTLVIRIHDQVLKSSFHLHQNIKLTSGSKILPFPRLRPKHSLLIPFCPVLFHPMCLLPVLLFHCHHWVVIKALCVAVNTFLDNCVFSLRGPMRISTLPNSLIRVLPSTADILWYQQSGTSQRLPAVVPTSQRAASMNSTPSGWLKPTHLARHPLAHEKFSHLGHTKGW